MPTTKLRPFILLSLLGACASDPPDGSGGSTTGSDAAGDTSASGEASASTGEGDSAGPGEVQSTACSRTIIALTRDGVAPDCQTLFDQMEEAYPGAIVDWDALTAIRDGLCVLDLAETVDASFMSALGELVHITKDCAPVLPIAEEMATECSSAAASAASLAHRFMGWDGAPDTPAATDNVAEIHVFDGASIVCDATMAECLEVIAGLGTPKSTAHLRFVATALYEALGADAARARIIFHDALDDRVGGVGQQGTRKHLLATIHDLLDEEPGSDVALALLPIGYIEPEVEQQEADPVRVAMAKLADRMPIVTGSGNTNLLTCDSNTGPTLPGGFACSDLAQPLCSRLLTVGALGLDGNLSATTRDGGVAPLLGPGFVVVGDEFTCRLGEGSSIGSARAAGLGVRVLLRDRAAAGHLGGFLYGAGTAMDLDAADLPIVGQDSPVPKRLNACAALNRAESGGSSPPRTCVAPEDAARELLAKLSSEIFGAWLAVRNASMRARCFSWFSPLPLVAGDVPSSDVCSSPQESQADRVWPLPPRLCWTCAVRVDPESSTSAQLLITVPDLTLLPDDETPICWVDLATSSGVISVPLDPEDVSNDVGTVFTVEHDVAGLQSATLVCEASGVETRFNVPILLGEPLTAEDAPISNGPSCKNNVVQGDCHKMEGGCRSDLSRLDLFIPMTRR